jgi:non-canonical (house-cleaning) NTP pyrophosphatase
MAKNVNVIIGSQNPDKLVGVRQAFELAFPRDEVVISAFSARSFVSRQPITSDETRAGSSNRAFDTLETIGSVPDDTFFVGLESGVFLSTEFPNNFITRTWATVIHNSLLADGSCGGIYLPQQVTPKIKEGLTVKQSLGGTNPDGALADCHPLLTRQHESAMATAGALAVFLRPEDHPDILSPEHYQARRKQYLMAPPQPTRAFEVATILPNSSPSKHPPPI